MKTWKSLGTCNSWDTKEPQVPERAALLERRVPPSEKSLLTQWVEWQSLPPAPKYHLIRNVNTNHCCYTVVWGVYWPWPCEWWWCRYVQAIHCYKLFTYQVLWLCKHCIYVVNMYDQKGFLRREHLKKKKKKSRKYHCYGNISLIKFGLIKPLHDKLHLLFSANVWIAIY